MGQTLTGNYTNTVFLGEGGIGDTITFTGSIQLGVYAGDGIFAAASIANAYLLNEHIIEGGSNGGSLTAGAGIYFGGVGTVVNAAGASIMGGQADRFGPEIAQAGGVGVDLHAGGMLVNQGSIAGGTGKYPLSGNGGNGGDGFYSFYRSSTVANDAGATINGGSGGDGASGGTGGTGGTGVYINDSGLLTNKGTIAGGRGGNSLTGTGGNGGAGFVDSYGATITNYGGATIMGGAGGNLRHPGPPIGPGGHGGAGIIGSYALITNDAGGKIYGGAAGNGGTAGIGVILGGGTLVNGSAGETTAAVIMGGGYGPYPDFGKAGYGVVASQFATVINFGNIIGAPQHGANGIGLLAEGLGVKITNAGWITGSAAGAASYYASGTADPGGTGVWLTSDAALSNTGTITGGTGGAQLSQFNPIGNYHIYDLSPAAAGGIGLLIEQSSGALSNAGTIRGGQGGYGFYSGAGGVGVSLEGGATLTNTGVIEGGASGQSRYYGHHYGAGGAGAYLNGGTLITSGSLEGGFYDNGTGGIGPQGDAVQFGTIASTLVIDPGATFSGRVVANDSVPDSLIFVGTSAGSIDGLGDEFAGFSEVTIAAGAKWTLEGRDNIAPATESIAIDGSLTINGALLGSANATIAAKGALSMTSGSDLQFGALTLTGNTVSCPSTGMITIGNPATGAAAGTVTIDTGATLSGFGKLVAKVAGSGTLAVSGGNMTVQGAIGGNLVATIAAKETLDLLGGGTIWSISGAGALKLDGTSPYTLAPGGTIGAATVTIDPNAALSGDGTYSGALANAGILTASGGTLSLGKSPTGKGTYAAASGATLDFTDGLTTAGTFSGAGTIRFDAASILDAGAKLLASTVIENANITLGTGASLTNAASHTFDITPLPGGTITLAGATGDTFTNLNTFACLGAGTADVKLGFVNSGKVSAGSGKLTFLGSLTNNGTMNAGTGVLTLASEALGAGTITIGTAGTLVLEDGAASAQAVQFGSSTGLLDLGHPLSFQGAIGGFTGKDMIDLLNTASTGFTFSGGTLTVENGTATVAKLAFAGFYTAADFALGSDGHGGTVVGFV